MDASYSEGLERVNKIHTAYSVLRFAVQIYSACWMANPNF